MNIELCIDGVIYNCVPKIKNKERIKNEIEERFIKFERSMNEYGISELIPIFYKHVLSNYRTLILMYLVPKLNLTRDNTRMVLALAVRFGILTNGANSKYVIPFDIRESILQLLKERSEV